MRKSLLVVACCGLLLVSPAPAEPAPAPATTPEPPAAITILDEEQLDLLARVIFTEARGEPFEGQVAVGAVAVNRLKDPRWPDDLREVLLAKGQFAPPTHINSNCLMAARLALMGLDPTGGAVYFYNPQTATDKWIFTRETICEIGKHRFAR
jgi:N-acetylmuramoyl-L-alanine amidase